MIPVDSVKDVVRSSVKVLQFDKHLKKAGHIGRNVVEITTKMKTIVQKPLMMKITKLRLRNFDNSLTMVWKPDSITITRSRVLYDFTQLCLHKNNHFNTKKTYRTRHAGEERRNSSVTFFYGPRHRLADQNSLKIDFNGMSTGLWLFYAKRWGNRVHCMFLYIYFHIYPTPLLGQDMTQGQFFKQSLTGFNSEFSFS